jgi:hypothetical protein
MKRVCLTLLLLCLTALPAVSQNQPPFILTGYGGLFFPANAGFHETFQSSSDLIYGFGVALPVASTLFVISDYAFFHADAFISSPNDSAVSLAEKFIHLGLMNKQPLSQNISLRFSAGINRISVTQRTSSAQSPEQAVDADTRVGYFAGIGLEQQTAEPHLAFFADVLYDYRRSRQRELQGDFGGVRLVIGAHIIMF